MSKAPTTAPPTVAEQTAAFQAMLANNAAISLIATAQSAFGENLEQAAEVLAGYIAQHDVWEALPDDPRFTEFDERGTYMVSETEDLIAVWILERIGAGDWISIWKAIQAADADAPADETEDAED